MYIYQNYSFSFNTIFPFAFGCHLLNFTFFPWEDGHLFNLNEGDISHIEGSLLLPHTFTSTVYFHRAFIKSFLCEKMSTLTRSQWVLNFECLFCWLGFTLVRRYRGYGYPPWWWILLLLCWIWIDYLRGFYCLQGLPRGKIVFFLLLCSF